MKLKLWLTLLQYCDIFQSETAIEQEKNVGRHLISYWLDYENWSLHTEMEADLNAAGLTAARHRVSRFTGRASYNILIKDVKKEKKKINQSIIH